MSNKVTSRSNNENKAKENKQNNTGASTSKPTVVNTNAKMAFIFSMIGGIFASLSSVCGKIVVDSSFLSSLISQTQIDLVIRAISISGIFISTTMQWRYAAKAMDLSTNSLSSTVITTASNFFFTAFFGWLFFKETLSIVWWIGASFIMFGLFLMNLDSNQQLEKEKKKQ
ncbi:hypothetical protein CYY_004585 [Polysphondylium violaceum]|uniref:EamA domain-containing protein n=1 Tax=Polysphondylium violaceum TaxID=133409 RepID=A0A8J4UZ59_9MYCE|nr:hypothetical protein CYY_004585 [Polysphondylium violaceum]